MNTSISKTQKVISNILQNMSICKYVGLLYTENSGTSELYHIPVV